MQLLLSQKGHNDQELLDTLGMICSGRGESVLEEHEKDIDVKRLALSLDSLKKSHPEWFMSCFDSNDAIRDAFLALLQKKITKSAELSVLFETYLRMLEREKSMIGRLQIINRSAALLALLNPEKRALLEYRLLPEELRKKISCNRFLLMRRLWPDGMDANLEQNGFGDCYFLSVLYTVSQAMAGREMILDLFEDRDGGNLQDGLAPWLVRFHGESISEKPLEERSLMDEGYAGRAVKGAKGTQILERLFARYTHRKEAAIGTETLSVGKGATFEGGYPRVAMKCLCGDRIQVDEVNLLDSGRGARDCGDHGLNARNFLFDCSDRESGKIVVLSTLSFNNIGEIGGVDYKIDPHMNIEKAVQMEAAYVAWHVCGKHDDEPPQPPSLMYKVPLVNSGEAYVHARHAYAVKDIDPVKSEFTLIDPIDTASNRHRMNGNSLHFFRQMTVGKFV